jgi:hypothetical protein
MVAVLSNVSSSGDAVENYEVEKKWTLVCFGALKI